VRMETSATVLLHADGHGEDDLLRIYRPTEGRQANVAKTTITNLSTFGSSRSHFRHFQRQTTFSATQARIHVMRLGSSFAGSLATLTAFSTVAAWPIPSTHMSDLSGLGIDGTEWDAGSIANGTDAPASESPVQWGQHSAPSTVPSMESLRGGERQGSVDSDNASGDASVLAIAMTPSTGAEGVSKATTTHTKECAEAPPSEAVQRKFEDLPADSKFTELDPKSGCPMRVFTKKELCLAGWRSECGPSVSTGSPRKRSTSLSTPAQVGIGFSCGFFVLSCGAVYMLWRYGWNNWGSCGACDSES
jgi:hypothetical protein